MYRGLKPDLRLYKSAMSQGKMRGRNRVSIHAKGSRKCLSPWHKVASQREFLGQQSTRFPLSAEWKKLMIREECSHCRSLASEEELEGIEGRKRERKKRMRRKSGKMLAVWTFMTRRWRVTEYTEKLVCVAGSLPSLDWEFKGKKSRRLGLATQPV